MNSTAPPKEPRTLAWIRDQILANAKVIYRNKETLEIVTARESMNFVRYDGTIETLYHRYACLVCITKQETTDKDGDEPNKHYEILLYGKSVVGTTEEALENLHDEIEDEMDRIVKKAIRAKKCIQ